MANMNRQIIPKRDMIRFLYKRKQEMTDKKLIAIADAKKDDHEKIMITTSFHVIVGLHDGPREKIALCCYVTFRYPAYTALSYFPSAQSVLGRRLWSLQEPIGIS